MCTSPSGERRQIQCKKSSYKIDNYLLTQSYKWNVSCLPTVEPVLTFYLDVFLCFMLLTYSKKILLSNPVSLSSVEEMENWIRMSLSTGCWSTLTSQSSSPSGVFGQTDKLRLCLVSFWAQGLSRPQYYALLDQHYDADQRKTWQYRSTMGWAWRKAFQRVNSPHIITISR